ncbi:pancreatic progenitor cell differentiation and proliferation factor-like protein isoform X1 [Poecile atricapillus]|uniref:pancreatic progenitor cell differentiation and proliferation factor-like protein isoform X1 n=1 Tax=Poecile atricapillus TaxID=48891 RepID=UPI00273952F2|nr:pancreatic progenitor cell differentiation and proliferation factor-like protein isoform X1 [Poecile atricapillus]
MRAAVRTEGAGAGLSRADPAGCGRGRGLLPPPPPRPRPACAAAPGRGEPPAAAHKGRPGPAGAASGAGSLFCLSTAAVPGTRSKTELRIQRFFQLFLLFGCCERHRAGQSIAWVTRVS